MRFKIGDKEIGEGCRAFLIMEVAQAHDGSLGTAHAFIDIAAKTGADAVKFQTHIASAESTVCEPFRVRFSRQDETRYCYWKRMEFSLAQWKELASHASEKGLFFLSSPFSVEAVDLLEQCHVPAWKVGSGEAGNTILLDRMLETGKPILLSTGMSPWQEIDGIVERIQNAGVPILLYQCTSRYPSPPEEVGLNLIREMRVRYQVPVGLSDHSGTIAFGIAAVAMGAASVEVHMTLSRYAFGPDVSSSLVPEDLGRMVRGIRAVEASLAHPLDKDASAAAMTDLKKMFGRGLVTRVPVRAGEVVTMEKLAAKKPALGLPPSQAEQVAGRRARRDLPADHFLTWDDLAGNLFMSGSPSRKIFPPPRWPCWPRPAAGWRPAPSGRTRCGPPWSATIFCGCGSACGCMQPIFRKGPAGDGSSPPPPVPITWTWGPWPMPAWRCCACGKNGHSWRPSA